MGEQGRLIETSAECVALATGYDFGALGERVGKMSFHFGEALLVDQRPDIYTSISAAPDLQCRHFRFHYFGKGVIYGSLHINPVGGHTGLSGVAIFGLHQTLGGGIQIGIIEDDERRIATQFQREFFDGVGALAHQDAADLGGAGEREFAHNRVGAQLLADRRCRRCITGDDVQYAFRYAGAMREFGHRQGGKRGLLGGLDNDGAPRCQCRAGFAGDHRIRKIPWRDCGRDTDRLLDDDESLVGQMRWNHIAIDTFAFLRKPFDE